LGYDHHPGDVGRQGVHLFLESCQVVTTVLVVLHPLIEF